MSQPPNFINLNFTSFKQKEEYKPPSNPLFVFHKPEQNQGPKKYVPKGEWAEDKDESANKTPEETQENVKSDSRPEKQQKQPKKFAFIKAKQGNKETTETQILSADQIKSDT